jgi:Domain of unknown function (DUF4349)
MRRMAIGLAIAAALLVACGGGAGDQLAETTGGQAQGEAPAFEGGGAAGGGGGTDAFAGAEAPAVRPAIIKTADLGVEVERGGFADAMSSATEIAARHGGFVVTSNRSGEDSRRGSVTVRIPSDAFEAALGEIRALGEVQHETVSGKDVGQEFVDLEARLRNLHATEAVLLRLFDEATSVADTIRIQNELTGIQLEIEQIEGRLRFLRDQTDLGTITVAIAEEGDSAPGRFGSAFDQAWDGILAVLSGIVIFLGYALPFLVIGLLVWLVWRRVARAMEREKEQKD